MKLTKKQLKFLLKVIDRSYMPMACESLYEEIQSCDDDKNGRFKERKLRAEFKDAYGVTIEKSFDLWNECIKRLRSQVRDSQGLSR